MRIDWGMRCCKRRRLVHAYFSAWAFLRGRHREESKEGSKLEPHVAKTKTKNTFRVFLICELRPTVYADTSTVVTDSV
jgi:hypothetical protein